MFIRNIHGQESASELARQIGCEAGECIHGSGYGRPGLIGNTYAIKDALKANGARFDGQCKAWTFESWAALESSILAILSA